MVLQSRYLGRYVAAAVGSALVFASACHGSSERADVVVEPTPAVPSDVVFYAHVLYGGDDAYLVDGRWYRPAANGWVVFTQEPLELQLVRQATERHASSWFGL